ncbi:MAG: hypothetical protein RL708_1900 [Bacteroidota bacterium]|jgi:hypothetical protein
MKKLITLGVFALLSTVAFSQEATTPTNEQLNSDIQGIKSDLASMKKLKISGYIQAQYQVADSMNVASVEGGNFSNSDKRFQLRRGRIKFDYSNTTPEGIVRSQFVFQMDMTESGFAIKDAYIKLTEPKFNWASLTVGSQNRPFGFEVPFSSSLRESPERGRMSQILFPKERDLGAMITLEGPKASRWNWLKIQGGLFNGNPNNIVEIDYRKDFIGQIVMKKSMMEERLKISGGASYYKGGIFQGTKKVYSMGTLASGAAGFTSIDSTLSNKNSFANREYMGLDAQASFDWKVGLSTLRAEYIQGTQPGTSSSTASPGALPSSDTYIRKFSGMYIYFIQNIMHSKHDVFVKYDIYDPNTKVKGSDLITKDVNSKSTNLSIADLAYSTLGVGYIYHFDENIKFTIYYSMVTNENVVSGNVTNKTKALNNFTRDIKDNVLTVRMQYKF